MANEADSANTTPDARWERVNALFHAAVARPLAERAAFLATKCSGDDGIRAEVESRLLAHVTGASAVAPQVSQSHSHSSSTGPRC